VSLAAIFDRISTAPILQKILAWSADTTGATSLQVKGAAGSLPAFVLRYLRAEEDHPVVALLGEAEEAAYLFSDLEQLPGSAPLLLSPPSDEKPYDTEHVPHEQQVIQRADVLQQLAAGFDGILITSVEAIMERVPPPGTVQQETLTISLGEEIAPEDLIARLIEQGFTRTEFAEDP